MHPKKSTFCTQEKPHFSSLFSMQYLEKNRLTNIRSQKRARNHHHQIVHLKNAFSFHSFPLQICFLFFRALMRFSSRDRRHFLSLSFSGSQRDDDDDMRREEIIDTMRRNPWEVEKRGGEPEKESKKRIGESKNLKNVNNSKLKSKLITC